MQAPLARALTGRAWSYTVLSASALSLTAVFGVLADAGWTLEQALLGGALVGLVLAAAGMMVQQRVRQGFP